MNKPKHIRIDPSHRKLRLDRETVRRLSNEELEQINGGLPPRSNQHPMSCPGGPVDPTCLFF